MKTLPELKHLSGAKVKKDVQPLVYENYKEPLKKIPKSEGYGYYGTLATTADKTLVQCHMCGNLYGSVAQHIRSAHKLSADEYKEKFGLSKTTALVSDEVRVRLQERVIKFFDGKLPDHLKEYNRKVQAGLIKHHGSGGAKKSLEWRNKNGVCPDQLLEKIKELAKKLGHTPSMDEFQEHYKGRYRSAIMYIHGGYLEAVRKAKLVSAKELKEPDNDRLLQDLIDFKKKYGRIPMSSDFARGLLRPRAMYFRRFGSLNNARVEAGLEAVIPMPFGQIVMMSPKEYLEYKKR